MEKRGKEGSQRGVERKESRDGEKKGGGGMGREKMMRGKKRTRGRRGGKRDKRV